MHKFVSFLFILIVIFQFFSCKKSTSPVESTLPKLNETQLQSVLDNYLNDNSGILGTEQQVDKSGYQPWGGASGYFDSTRTQPLKWDDKFLIGSITKTFTATIVLQLWEQGMVDLDNFIINCLPIEISAILDSIPYGDTVTVRQALQHRSGIWSYTRSWPLIVDLYANPAKDYSVVDILTIVKNEGQPDFVPGMGFRYSNTNFILLGSLVESVTGQDYNEVLYQNIIQRLGLANTFMPIDLPINYEGIAHGYEDDFDNLAGGQTLNGLNFNIGSNTAWAAGGLVSTTEDLNTFLRALVSNELFTNDSTFQMMIGLPENDWYGMGIFVRNHSTKGTYYGHGGGIIGFGSYAYYFVEHDMAISGCLNLDGTIEYIAPEGLMDLILEYLP
jgi:D-alanyl-D-alanine carboxypeptidase